MKKELITTLQTEFNKLSNTLENSNIEYWFARDLQKVLGYARWENFGNLIQKAKTAYKNSSIEISDHFRNITKMVEIGSNTQRPIEDIMPTRYACYLITQKEDSKNE